MAVCETCQVLSTKVFDENSTNSTFICKMQSTKLLILHFLPNNKKHCQRHFSSSIGLLKDCIVMMIYLRTCPYSHIPTMQRTATAHTVLKDAAIAAASKAPCSSSLFITKTPREEINNIKSTEITVPIIENT